MDRAVEATQRHQHSRTTESHSHQLRDEMIKWWNVMLWYGMVWYGMVWYGMVWYGMVWYVIKSNLGGVEIKRWEEGCKKKGKRYETIFFILMACCDCMCMMMWYDVTWCDEIRLDFSNDCFTIEKSGHNSFLYFDGATYRHTRFIINWLRKKGVECLNLKTFFLFYLNSHIHIAWSVFLLMFPLRKRKEKKRKLEGRKTRIQDVFVFKNK